MYISYEDQKKRREQEKQFIGISREIGHIDCVRCKKHLVRAFEPTKKYRHPSSQSLVKDHMKGMSKAMKRYPFMPSNVMLNGPEYNLLFATDHFNSLHLHRLDYSSNHTYGYCTSGLVLEYSMQAAVSRILLRYSAIRIACIANDVKPKEVYDWIAKQSLEILDSLLPGANIAALPGTDLWVAQLSDSKWYAKVPNYNVKELLGDEWAAEVDPIFSDSPGFNDHGSYSMRQTYAGLTYTCSTYNSQIVVEFSDPSDFTKLPAYGYNKLIAIRTPSGRIVNVKLDGSIVAKSGIVQACEAAYMPKRFYSIQPDSIHDAIMPVVIGDILL